MDYEGGTHFAEVYGNYKWKNVESIISNYSICIYERPGFKIENKIQARIQVLTAPLLEISATEIRETIRNGKSVRYMVPDVVREELESGGYYKK